MREKEREKERREREMVDGWGADTKFLTPSSFSDSWQSFLTRLP